MACPLPRTPRRVWAPVLLALVAACDRPDPGTPGGATAPALSAADIPAATVTSDKLTVMRVDSAIGKPDPTASWWKTAPATSVQLLAQPMVTPRPEATTTEGLTVQAVHDGTTVAFRLRWADTEINQAGRLGEYSDAVAMQFVLIPGQTPPPMMGGEGMPVHIFHWRAQYQRDALEGKPTIATLYPNASIDMYAMDFHDAPGGSRDEQEMFNPGVALGNPQSFHKTSVDEIIAEGFATSAVQAGHGSDGLGMWVDGAWTVVITRPMQIEGGSTLTPGANALMCFAVWQGGKDEVGSRKSLTMSWQDLQVSP